MTNQPSPNDETSDLLARLRYDLEAAEQHSFHSARLRRAVMSIDEIIAGNTERCNHALSRLGIWAEYLAEAMTNGECRIEEAARQLALLARAGNLLLSSAATSANDVAIADFGTPLSFIRERDIDLLLLEEMQVDDRFAAWFLQQAGIEHAGPARSWHSVTRNGSEIDLLLVAHQDERRIALLIENKVAAPEQELQAERYHENGMDMVRSGAVNEYRTIICAPQRYLESLPPESPYQTRLAYERIAEWLRAQPGRRADWKHGVILAAIEQSRRGYEMIENPTALSFHRKYWANIRKNHPLLQMAEPEKRGRNSSWIILKGTDFPKGVNLNHKLDQNVMELGFSRRSVRDLLAIKSHWPDDIGIVQKGNTASLSIDVPPIDFMRDFDDQAIEVEEALRAAYALIPFAQLFNPAR